MVLIAVGIFGMAFVRVVYMLTNRQRTKKISVWGENDYKTELESSARRGDQKYTFMYGY